MQEKDLSTNMKARLKKKHFQQNGISKNNNYYINYKNLIHKVCKIIILLCICGIISISMLY